MAILITFSALLLITLVFFLTLSSEKKDEIEFFHVVAHRFRSPISIIKWYIELLSNKSVGTLNDKQKEYFTQIYNASEKLTETIDSLIVLLQLQSNSLILKKEKVSIKDLIGKIIQKMQFKIERRKLHVQETYPKERDTIIQGDTKLLNIVFQNIIENAIKYIPENGNISVNVHALNKKVFIEIQDNGYGITKERKSRVLANSINSRDMGFSLYLAKLILRKMNASISFKSEKNKGTTFFITIPI